MEIVVKCNTYLEWLKKAFYKCSTTGYTKYTTKMQKFWRRKMYAFRCEIIDLMGE